MPCVSGSHGATAYTVVATVTVPVVCPDNSVENIVIQLGAPGQLNGGGVATYTHTIPRETPQNTQPVIRTAYFPVTGLFADSKKNVLVLRFFLLFSVLDVP